MGSKQLNKKECALWLTNHEGIRQYVGGEISYKALQNYKAKLTGVNRFSSDAHKSTIQKMSGQTLTVAELKRHFTLSQLRSLTFSPVS